MLVGACGHISGSRLLVGCYKQKIISSRRLVRVAVEAVLSEAEATWRYDDGSQSLTVLSFPAYVSIRQHTSAYVSIRLHTYADCPVVSCRANTLRIRQHTSAYVSIRQHTSAYEC